MLCQICKTDAFSDINVFFRHLKVFHPLECEYKCINNDCSRKFVTIPALKKHVLHCTKSNVANNETNVIKSFKKPFVSEIKKSNDNQSINLVNQNEIMTISIPDVDSVEKQVLEFISKLYANNSITKTVINEITENLITFTENVTLCFKENLKSKLKQESSFIDECLQTHFLDKFNSDSRRLKMLKEYNVFEEPISFCIGEISDNKKVGQSTVWTKKKCYGYLAPLKVLLKTFLELPNVYQEIFNFIQSETTENEKDIYTSIFSGSRWKEISKDFDEKFVLPVILYYDDFEINDPLSTSAGVYKIGGLYFSLAGVPPQYSSMLENVFYLQFTYTEDHKIFKNEKCFRKVIEEFQYLFTEGLDVTINCESKKIYFVVIAILGDNLGVNSLFGFSESFTSNFYCRFCRASKYNAYKLCAENDKLIRTLKSYEEDVVSNDYGVKEKCVFNELPHFHNILNHSCDLMHDFYLGICRYDMSRIINYLIKENYFTLNQLNERLKYFDYDEVDRGNKISSISAKHLKNGYIIISASEMSALITYLGIIIGDLIPPDDLVWELYLVLNNIIDLITSPTIAEQEIMYLEVLIRTHNELFVNLFEEPLKPKMHIITHYPRIIRIMGPLKYMSCEKYEAFHKNPKKYAKIVNSRVNILFTIATKMQLGLAYRFLCKHGFKNIIEFGPTIKLLNQQTVSCDKKDSKFLLDQVPYVKINRTTYKARYGVFVQNDTENNPIIGMITRICKSINNEALLFYKECETLGLDTHVKGYVLVLPSRKQSEHCYKLSVKHFKRPFKIHINAEGKSIVAARDLS